MSRFLDQSPRVLLAAVLLCLAPVGVPAQESDSVNGEDVNYVELAALLIQDGHYARARDALSQVDIERDDLDRPRFHLLQGLVMLNLKQPGMAERAFLNSLAAGQEDRVVYVYLAQAHFQQDNYREALGALEQSRDAGSHLPAVYFMAARSRWELEMPSEAIAILEQARKRFVDETPFVRQKIFYLIRLGLYRAAADLGMSYLAGHEAGAEDYIAIGSALRESQQYEQALRFLEAARLQYPRNVEVAKVLAHVYLDQGKTLSAAQVMEEAARVDAGLNVEAAELHRRAGNLFQALALNAQVGAQDRKLKQRLAILLALERYEQVAGMNEALQRNGLLEDQDIRYALAYALFKSGDFDRAEGQLAQLERGDLFRKAVELREAMKDCRAEPWRCY